MSTQLFLMAGSDRDTVLKNLETMFVAYEEVRTENIQLRKDLSDARQIIDEENKYHIEQMAEREAEIVVLKGTLDMWLLSTIKDRGDYAAERSFTREALSTPPSTSYLEQWERERYGEPRSYLYKIYMPNGDTAWTTELRNRECLESLPLYARKD